MSARPAVTESTTARSALIAESATSGTTSAAPHNHRSEWILALALFCSGAAALVNQSVWQRSLNIYLAGCEAISAMVVVLVFMLGLGLGSFCVGWRSRHLRDPLLWLAIVELLLLGLNLGLAA